MTKQTIVIVGAGVFGITAALELCRRGWRVQLLDPGPLPHLLAASTDISKVVRMEYGADALYVAMAEASLEGWRRWNEDWKLDLYHETGTLFARGTTISPGTLEGESLRLLRERGHPVELLDRHAIRARFPAWNAEAYCEATFNPCGGFAESSKVMVRLLEEAVRTGVELHIGPRFSNLWMENERVRGIKTADGTWWAADRVLVAGGAWTPYALPFLAAAFRTVGMPVFHLQPADPEPFWSQHFPVFGADITRTGYYGFPANRDGIVKIASHGTGRLMHPQSAERVVTEEETARLREFLPTTFPLLADAPLVYTRVCLYCDTQNGDFWIDADPDRAGLVIAAGGSGHAFKFAPILGGLIADAVERRRNSTTERFRWRMEAGADEGMDAARAGKR